jgi:hypothetical protein
MNCAKSFYDYLVQCPDGIKVNLVADAGPYAEITWRIVDKFGHHYTGQVTTDGYGGFTIPVADLPAGLLTSYSGEFELTVLADGYPVRFIIAGYYESITFWVERGTQEKSNLGVEIPCP